jgi:hypothetical protein
VLTDIVVDRRRKSIGKGDTLYQQYNTLPSKAPGNIGSFTPKGLAQQSTYSDPRQQHHSGPMQIGYQTTLPNIMNQNLKNMDMMRQETLEVPGRVALFGNKNKDSKRKASKDHSQKASQ